MGEVIPEGAKCREQNKQLKRMTGLRVSGSSKLKESGLRRCPRTHRETQRYFWGCCRAWCLSVCLRGSLCECVCVDSVRAWACTCVYLGANRWCVLPCTCAECIDVFLHTHVALCVMCACFACMCCTSAHMQECGGACPTCKCGANSHSISHSLGPWDTRC